MYLLCWESLRCPDSPTKKKKKKIMPAAPQREVEATKLAATAVDLTPARQLLAQVVNHLMLDNFQRPARMARARKMA
jgi:hypothetical protein